MEKRVEQGIGKMIMEYIRSQRRMIMCILLMDIFMVAISCLYHVEQSVIIYIGEVWLFFFLVSVCVDFLHFWQKCKRLSKLSEGIKLSIDGLPEADTLVEKQYQKLLAVQHQDKVNRLSKVDHERQDMLDYYAMWVHQIKTPIAGMSLVLQSAKIEEKEILKEELFRIEQYVEMVTSYLRLQSEQHDFVIKKYPVTEMVHAVVKKFSGQFIYRKIKLNMEIEEKQVLTDAKWMMFILEQILSNALKYTEKGSIAISFQDNQLSVKDTGIGIEKEDLPRIFEKGYTGYNGRMHQKSSGIGLYLVKQAADRISCKIRVESESGQGTRVTITFPQSLSMLE